MTWAWAPGLFLWMLPVSLPMVLAPLLISWSSQRQESALYATPWDAQLPEIVKKHDATLADWLGLGQGMHPEPKDPIRQYA